MEEYPHREQLQRLREIASCPNLSPADAFQHRRNISTINFSQLREDLQSLLVFDYTLHREIGCLLDALFHSYTNNTLLHDRVRTYIAQPEKIINFNLNIFQSGFLFREPLFVIKTNHLSSLECLYEYVVGKLIVNPLRALLPNFMYTYSYHECGTYAVVEDGMRGWCTTEEPQMSYLYLERIIGKTLLEFCLEQEEGSEPFVEVILQIINALYVAYEECSFRHNDLHGRNIIVRELAQPVCIPIVVLGSEQYLHTRYVPQIIDFGTATALYEGVMLQSPNYDNMLARSNSSFPHDVFMRGLWIQLWNDYGWYPRMYLWGDDLKYDTPEKDQTFGYIAEGFIEIMGYNPLHSYPIAPNLPLSIIGSTQRFYQRYNSLKGVVEREYSFKEYYHLIDLIKSYQLSDDVDELRTRISLAKIPLTKMLKDLLQAVYNLTRTFPSSDVQRVDDEVIEGIFLQIDRLYEIIDYLYILKSYHRLVLPVILEYQLILEGEEKELSDVIKVVTLMYEKRVRQTRASIKELQRRLFFGGHDIDDYINIVGIAVHRLFLLPSARDV